MIYVLQLDLSLLFIFLQDYRTFVNEATARWTVSYLIINVTDVDDLGAIFTKNVYKVTLREDSPPVSCFCSVFFVSGRL